MVFIVSRFYCITDDKQDGPLWDSIKLIGSIEVYFFVIFCDLKFRNCRLITLAVA